MLVSALLGLLVVVAFAALGAVVVRLILGRPDRVALVGLSIPVGGGVLTWCIFIASWAGIPITAISCLLVWLLLLVAAVGLIRLSWPRLDLRPRIESRDPTHLDRWVELAAWSLFTVLIGVAAFLSIGHGYGSWDAAAGWGAKGYGIAKEGTVFAAESWGAWGLTYPLNIPIQIGLFQIYGRDLIPVSKILFPVFLASLGIGTYHFWRRQGVSRLLSGLGMVFLVSVPLIFLHGTEGYANLPLTAYLVQGGLWGISGLRLRDRRALLMSGLLFGVATWTRPEAFGYCGVAIVVLVVAHLLSGRRDFPWAWWLAPLVVMAGVWLIFGWSGVTSDRLGGGAVSAMLSAWKSGDIHLREAYLIPRLLYDRVLEPTRWGALFQVVAVLVVLRLVRVRPRTQPVIFALFILAAFFGFVAAGLFYLQSYSLGSNYITVLNRSFDRAFFPAAVLMVVTAIRLYGPHQPAPENAGRSRAVVGSHAPV